MKERVRGRSRGLGKRESTQDAKGAETGCLAQQLLCRLVCTPFKITHLTFFFFFPSLPPTLLIVGFSFAAGVF